MKVLAKDLQKAIKRIEKVVETKKSLPVLGHVRVRLDGDHLALEATDLDAYLVTRIPVEEAGPVDVIAPFHELKAAATLVTNATGAVTIAAGEGFRVGPVMMRTLPVEEFPAVPGEPCPDVGTAAEGPLLEALKAVAPAACTEEGRYAIRSICWEVREGEGTFTATDGHRLHVVRAPIELSDEYRQSLVSGTPIEVLLNARPAQALIGCLGKETVRFGLSADRKLLRVTGRDYTLWMRPLDATYPNWRQVVPEDGHLAVLHRKALLDAATRAVKVFRSSWSATPCLVLTENGPTVDAVLDRGSDQLPVPCGQVPVLGGDLEKDYVFAVNARYLAEALTPMRADAVQVQFRDPVSPLRLSCEGESFRSIVMPLRVDGKGFRILDDESLVAVQGPVPVQPEPEDAEEADEPMEAVADETGEPEDLMEGEPADDEPAVAPPPPPEEGANASPEAPAASQAASVDAPTDQPEDEFPPLEELLVPAAEAIGRQVVIEATAFEITEVSIRLKGPNGVESYGVRGFLDRLAAA